MFQQLLPLIFNDPVAVRGLLDPPHAFESRTLRRERVALPFTVKFHWEVGVVLARVRSDSDEPLNVRAFVP